MPDDPIFEVFVNPLAFLEVDEPWAHPGKPGPELNAVMGMLCSPEIDKSMPALVARYKEISTEPNRLNAAPMHDQILEKLVWPLRNAKASYMIGNYLGTISLCGMVGEMTAILFFETAEISINRSSFDSSNQTQLLGRSFEQLGQERRIKVLTVLGVIDDETKDALETIRKRRRRYLHHFSQKHDQIAAHAVEVFHSAVTAVVKVIGQDINEGRLVLRPAMYRYLEREGLI